jgi:hypothetical protein
MVVDEDLPGDSGPSTTGYVVFYGTLDGLCRAADEGTPKERYKFHAPSGILGNPMTYKYKGTQYVAVLVVRWRVGCHRSRCRPTKAPKASVRSAYHVACRLYQSRRNAAGRFHYSLAITDLDPANSANVVCTLGTRSVLSFERGVCTRSQSLGALSGREFVK